MKFKKKGIIASAATIVLVIVSFTLWLICENIDNGFETIWGVLMYIFISLAFCLLVVLLLEYYSPSFFSDWFEYDDYEEDSINKDEQDYSIIMLEDYLKNSIGEFKEKRRYSTDELEEEQEHSTDDPERNKRHSSEWLDDYIKNSRNWIENDYKH